MAKLSLAELGEIISTFVDEDKIAVPTFSATANNLVGLLDKVGKILTLDTDYVDKLAIFDGEDLPFGKTIEEWQQNLILPEDYSDADYANALAPHYPTYMPVAYSYTLGRKRIPLTIKNNDIERAVNNVEQFNSLTTMQTKRLFDSIASFRYGCKREMLNVLIKKCDEVVSDATTFSASSSYAVGAYLKSSSEYGIVVKPITASQSATSTWAKCKEAGYVVLLDLVEEIAVPVDTSTGEAFIKQLKKDVEVASDISEGHSLNGNTLGASNLVLIVKQGVMPEIEVDVIAGAFQKEAVASPVEVIKVKNFGADETKCFAMLVDARAIKLHNTYRATRQDQNGYNDWLNLTHHTEDTAYISRNTFVRVYRPAA